MKRVNVYVYTTVKGPRRHSGAYTYVLEVDTSKGPATKSHKERLENVTEHQADLLSLAAALKRIYKQCHLVIYTDSVYLASGIEKWLDGWQKNDWKSAKGKKVANAEEWKELAILLNEHEYELCVRQKHSYYEWMVSEAEKVTRECMQ